MEIASLESGVWARRKQVTSPQAGFWVHTQRTELCRQRLPKSVPWCQIEAWRQSWRKPESSLNCQAKREHSRQVPLRPVPPLEGVVRSLTGFEEQGVVSSWTHSCLVGGEVIGSQLLHPSGSNQSEVFVLVGSTQLTSSTWWGFSLCKRAPRTWLRIFSLVLSLKTPGLQELQLVSVCKTFINNIFRKLYFILGSLYYFLL